MSYVAIADQHAHLHDPQTFITKYVWSQDHKVIAIQYMVDGDRRRAGGARCCRS